jgi:toxin ParE1/3/4
MSTLLRKPLAEADLLDIWDFIANESPEKADRFLQKIETKLKILAENPGMGRNRDELVPSLQSFPEYQKVTSPISTLILNPRRRSGSGSPSPTGRRGWGIRATYKTGGSPTSLG